MSTWQVSYDGGNSWVDWSSEPNPEHDAGLAMAKVRQVHLAEQWRPMETAPTDDTTVRLLVDYTSEDACHPLEDAQIAETIGTNTDSNTGTNEGWKFAGWSWEQDCFCEGRGKPIGWLPLVPVSDGVAFPAPARSITTHGREREPGEGYCGKKGRPVMSDKELHILQHSLGLDEYGRRRHDRNHFVTGEGSDDYPHCMAMVEAGLMTRRAGNEISGGDDIFHVTQAGKDHAIVHSPKPPKLTRSQLRYQEYLDADCYDSFGDFLKARQS